MQGLITCVNLVRMVSRTYLFYISIRLDCKPAHWNWKLFAATVIKLYIEYIDHIDSRQKRKLIIIITINNIKIVCTHAALALSHYKPERKKCMIEHCCSAVVLRICPPPPSSANLTYKIKVKMETKIHDKCPRKYKYSMKMK